MRADIKENGLVVMIFFCVEFITVLTDLFLSDLCIAVTGEIVKFQGSMR